MSLVWEAVALSLTGAGLFFVGGHACSTWRTRNFLVSQSDRADTAEHESSQLRDQRDRLQSMVEELRRVSAAHEIRRRTGVESGAVASEADAEEDAPSVRHRLHSQQSQSVSRGVGSTLRQERDRLHAERDGLRVERNRLAQLHGSLRAERDRLHRELSDYREALAESRAHVETERDQRRQDKKAHAGAMAQLSEKYERSTAELAQMVEKLDRWEGRELENDELAARLARVIEERDAVRGEVRELRNGLKGHEQRLQSSFQRRLEHLTKVAHQQRSGRESAVAEVRKLQARVAALTSKADRARELFAEVLRLRQELEASSISSTRRTIAESEELAKRDLEHRKTVRTLESKVRENEHYAAETLVLRRELAQARASLAKAADMRRELERLQALELAEKSANTFQFVTDSYAAAVQDEQGEFSKRLDFAIRRVLQDGRYNTGVLSDSQGFTIWGVGDGSDHDELSAVAAESDTWSTRARQLLPLAKVREVSLVDANGLELRSRFIDWNGETLCLTTVGLTASSRELPPQESSRRSTPTAHGIRAIMDELGGRETTHAPECSRLERSRV